VRLGVIQPESLTRPTLASGSTRSYIWERFSNPATARGLERLPRVGDLVLTQNGAGPFVVRSVRVDKADLIDHNRKEGTVPFELTLSEC